MKIIEKFLKYVKFDTQSSTESNEYPSTSKQLILLDFLKQELSQMKVEAEVDEYGYLIARIPSNVDKEVPTLALIAHVDTSPDASGKDVNPKIIENYDGKDILLNDELNVVLSPKKFPSLNGHVGHDIIVTDGSTLLGADDKLGVAEIMAIVEYIQDNPDYKHGEIVVLFTPDEEVGGGTKYIDVKKLKADFAYTLDGGKVGEIAYENFNAAGAKVTLYGRSVHPGAAKNKMIHSVYLVNEFGVYLPNNMRPELTEGYEGFNHLISVKGTVEKTELVYIIRNHDRELFEKQKLDFVNACELVNKKYGDQTCILEIKDQYFNMNEILKDHQWIVDMAKQAIIESDIDPIIEPIRGGTDGARLTYLGLPCPNLGTGGYNFHGPYEYCSIQEANKAAEIVLKIISKTTELKK